MIETMHLEKSFGHIRAVNDVTLTMADGEIFGLVGTNGAGKSTFLRLLAGVLRPDGGEILVDQEKIWDNPARKADLFFVPSDFYFFPNATPQEMGAYFAALYPKFDRARYEKLLREFGIDRTRRIQEFSKGMKRQTAILLGISSGTKYLLLDETFDGLDPLMRQQVRTLFAGDMAERGLTPILTSHDLRDIEDLCDRIGLLHAGGILLSEHLAGLREGMQKVQVVFASEADRAALLSKVSVKSDKKRGKLETILVEANREQTEAAFRAVGTVYFEILPLTLEEVFISKTEGMKSDGDVRTDSLD
jgi:ABC-2 type transport system ATP-binding protein